MKEFWIVVGYDQYYPCAGLGNILAVTYDEEEAKAILEEKEASGGRDYYELYSSDELPWV